LLIPCDPNAAALDEELSRIDSEIAHLQRSLEAATQQAEAVGSEWDLGDCQ
jgi:hypothetical protein